MPEGGVVPMPIKTYSKFSKAEGRALTYLRWQGYQGGQWVQKHLGRAEVNATQIRALKLEIEYLNEQLDNLLSELVSKKQKIEELQARLNELEGEGRGDNEE
jgi:predicted RNase H-like nuclease (RuvC/YqgF family)